MDNKIHPELYQHPQVEWDRKRCEKLAKRIAKDSLGTKYPWAGHIHNGEIGGRQGLIAQYNGGVVIEGKWWPGEQWQLPKLPEGFQFVYMTTWGWRLIKTSNVP